MDDKAVGLLEDINVKYLGRLGIWPEAKKTKHWEALLHHILFHL